MFGEAEHPSLQTGPIDVARVLAWIGRLVEQLRTPRVADLAVRFAMEDRQVGHLRAIGVFPVVVTLEAVVRGGEQAQMLSSAITSKNNDVLDGGFRDDDEVDLLLDVRHGARHARTSLEHLRSDS
jgi:hypothetical protein